MDFACAICGGDSGSSLVCPACLPHMKQGTKDRLMRVWHKLVIERDRNECVYCGFSATTESGELCGNHKETQGSAPTRVLDVENGECVCKNCNTKHSYSAPTERKKEIEASRKAIKKAPTCKHSGCPIFAMGSGKKPDKCWKHQ